MRGLPVGADCASTERTRPPLSCQGELAKNAASEPASWKPQAVETGPVAHPCAAVRSPRGQAAHKGPELLACTCGSLGRNVCFFLCRVVLPIAGEQLDGLPLTGCIFGKRSIDRVSLGQVTLSRATPFSASQLGGCPVMPVFTPHVFLEV